VPILLLKNTAEKTVVINDAPFVSMFVTFLATYEQRDST
jgi:hypothetical protein